MEGKQGDSSLDLSHLTEEEQTSILQVVQRDLELRRRDEGRVRTLEQRETNSTRLRFLSGAWFSEECSKRHLNWTSGCDLVHATIRHRKTKSRDVPLNGLFNIEREDNNNTLLETEGRVQDSNQEETEGTQSLKPVPTSTVNGPVSQVLQHSNSSSSSKECETRSNGQSEEPETHCNGSQEAVLQLQAKEKRNSARLVQHIEKFYQQT